MLHEILIEWDLLFNRKPPLYSGVYAFIVNKKIMYIGSSWCLRNRISSHPIRRTLLKTGNLVDVYFFKTNDYQEFEKICIKKANPILNTQWVKKSNKVN